MALVFSPAPISGAVVKEIVNVAKQKIGRSNFNILKFRLRAFGGFFSSSCRCGHLQDGL